VLYLPGVGGVRIEDTLVVTEDGSRTLTGFHKGRRCLMAVSTNDLKNGMTLDLPEGLFTVVEFQHVKPGKGRRVRPHQAEERALRRGHRPDVSSRREARAGIIDKRDMQFLYRDGADYRVHGHVLVRAAECDVGLAGRGPPSI